MYEHQVVSAVTAPELPGSLECSMDGLTSVRRKKNPVD